MIGRAHWLLVLLGRRRRLDRRANVAEFVNVAAPADHLAESGRRTIRMRHFVVLVLVVEVVVGPSIGRPPHLDRTAVLVPQCLRRSPPFCPRRFPLLRFVSSLARSTTPVLFVRAEGCRFRAVQGGLFARGAARQKGNYVGRHRPTRLVIWRRWRRDRSGESGKGMWTRGDG